MRRSSIAVALDCLREIRKETRSPYPVLLHIDNCAAAAIGALLSTDEDEVAAYWAEHCSEHGAHGCVTCREADADDDRRAVEDRP